MPLNLGSANAGFVLEDKRPATVDGPGCRPAAGTTGSPQMHGGRLLTAGGRLPIPGAAGLVWARDNPPKSLPHAVYIVLLSLTAIRIILVRAILLVSILITLAVDMSKSYCSSP